MNIPHDHSAGDRDAREWAAQERARQHAHDAEASPGALECGSGFSRELFGTRAPSVSPGDAAYRRIAEALRRPPPVDLPPDFADRVARMAGQWAPAAVANRAQPESTLRSGEFERALVGVLACVWAVCALVAGGVYGPGMFAQVQAAIGPQGLQWTALLAGCLALSWSFEWLRRRAGHGGAMRPA